MHATPTGSTAPSRPSLDATLSFGFRPFFALAALAAVLLPAGWLALLAGWRWPGAPAAPLSWHAHEMLFGFVSAAIAGFLLTAVPGFTRRPPVTGAPLAALALAWLAARLLAAFAGAAPATLVVAADTGFLLLLAIVAGRDIVLAGNRRNLVLVALVLLLALASLSDHLGWHRAGAQPGLHVVLLLVTVLGGRIVPSFTANWLKARGVDALPGRRPWLEAVVLATTALVGLMDSFGPAPAVAVAAAAAALVHGARLWGWQGGRTRREPLLAVLHLAYAWLPAGYALLTLAALGLLPRVAALHAFGMGVVGTMILAVMTRAALGHTGRPLRAPASAVAAYALVTLAAALRVAGGLWPAAWSVLVPAAGAAWMAAFVLFLAGYLPVLTRPRVL